MFDVCWGCGQWTPEKEIDPAASIAVCPECGHEHPIEYRPLFVVTGASGAGKSTVLHELVRRNATDSDDRAAANAGSRDGGAAVVPMESDVLWGAGADMDLEAYADLWLRVCKEIHQAGRSVLLFGAGMNPDNLESPTHRRYFPAVHYLALVTTDDELAARLRARPDWRESSSEEFIAEQLEYNQHLKDGQWDVPWTALDTTDRDLAETAAAVERWIDDVLSG